MYAITKECDYHRMLKYSSMQWPCKTEEVGPVTELEHSLNAMLLYHKERLKEFSSECVIPLKKLSFIASYWSMK